MDSVKLITNGVFVQAGVPTKINIAGVNMDRFNSNPTMLYNHNYDKIIGKWNDVAISEDGIVATPDFDTDESSVTYRNKFEKGSLKGASIGIEVLDYEIVDEVLVIQNSILLEASLTPVPADPKALKQVKLSYQGKTIKNFNQMIDNKIVTEEVTVVKEDEESIVAEQESVIVEEVVIEATENVVEPIVEVVEVVEENVMTFTEVPTDYNQTLTVTGNNNTVIGVPSDTEIVTDVVELSKEVVEDDGKDTLISELQAKIAELSNKLEVIELAKKETVIATAIADGKITEASKSVYMDFAYDKLVTLLDSIKTSNVINLNKELMSKRNTDVDGKTYAWYLVNDKTALFNLERSNPTLFAELQRAYINK